MNKINNEKAMKRSKTQICSAVMKLLETTPYNKLTISQVCSTAGISRPTFYNNFQSMDAVVHYKLEQMKERYDRKHSYDSDISLRFADFYSFVKCSKELNLLIVRNRLFHIFGEQIRDEYLDYIMEHETDTLDEFHRDYLPEYLSATIISLLQRWMDTGYRETPEQMAEITSKLMNGYMELFPWGAGRGPSDYIGGSTEKVSDILNNLPVGVCVLFMPDDTHQEIRFANKQQMRLISPNMPAPEKVDPQSSRLRSSYYKNAFSGVHPDDLDMALETFHNGFDKEQFTVPSIRLKTGSGGYIWVTMDVSLRETLPEGRLFYATYRDISKDVQLRQDLETQRQKNVEKTLLDTIGHLPDCSVLYREDYDGTFIPERFSEEYLQFMGYTDESVMDMGGSLIESIHPDDRNDAAEMLKKCSETGKANKIVLRIRIKNDGYKWVSINITRFSFSEEWYIYVVFTDIDDLKKQEQLLQKQYDAAQTFMDSVSDTYLMTQRSNLSQNTIEVLRGKGSPPAAKWEGAEYDDLVKTILQQIQKETDRKKCEELLSRSFLMESFEKGIRTVTREFQTCPLGQETLWLEGISTISRRPGSGDVISFLAISDIREKKLTELIIKKIVAEQCDYVSCINAKTGKFVLFFTNRRWNDREDVTPGCDYDEAREKIFSKYVHPEERKRYLEFTNLQHVLNDLKKTESVTALFNSEENGSHRIKQIEFSYLDRANGLVALVKTDITEANRQQMEQEERLREALNLAERANEAKSAFLSSMSHDLRTPLNGVLGFTSFALKEDDVQKKQEYLEKIESSGQLLLDLINDTLDLSRIESGKAVPEPETVMLDDLISAVVTTLRPSAELKGVNLIEDLSDYQNETMWADKLKINKIVLNLLSNSIKFTPEGGTVTVTPYCTPMGDDNCELNFVIEDTGIGMSREFMKLMYEPFAQETRSESIQIKGTGLGLSIVKQYVNILGGEISVKSKIHAGTRWTVTIPVTKLQHGVEEKPGPKSIGNLNGHRILLCEDNYMNIEITTMLLKDRGVIVETAEDGEAGLKKYSASAEGYYDAVLMDIRMPVMDGYEAAKRIRELKRGDALKVPIIALTADAFVENINAAKEAGMNDFITKPLEPKKLYEVLQRQIDLTKR